MQVKLFRLKTIDSTNAWAKREAATFDRDSLTVVTAEEQTAGYGRRHRRWISSTNENITVSFCFFVPLDFECVFNVAQVISLAIAQCFDQLHFKIRLKWPNDLMIHGRKVGGILCETSADSSHLCVVAGVGLNVNMKKEALGEIDQPATSLAVEYGSPLELERTFDVLMHAVGATLEMFIHRGFDPFLQEYRRFLTHASNDLMQIHQADRLTTGRFVGIDESGALQLRLADGSVATIVAGEVQTPARIQEKTLEERR
jgi:BirA family biotin operon repressor/biotin-[acetyl-CoA-carboxylase] ligase